MSTIEEYQKYKKLAEEAEKKYNLPSNLLMGLMKTESNFNNNAVSSAGAQGIMQFMESTAKDFGIDPRDPNQSIPAAAKYLSQLHKQTGNWDDALRSYNFGLANVQKWKAGKKQLPKETAEYVGKVYKNANIDYTPTSTDYKAQSPITDEAIRNTNDYFRSETPTTSVKDLQDNQINTTFTDETPSEKDADIEEVKQKTQEQNFLKEYGSVFSNQEVPQQEIKKQEIIQPRQSVTDIYNKVSNFVENPIAQQGLQYYDLPQNNANPITPRQFTIDYIKSPKYKERLIKSGYENPSEEVRQRLFQSNPKVSPYREPKQPNFLKSLLGAEKVEGERGSFYSPVTKSITLDTNNDINTFKDVYPNSTAPTKEEIETHERSHSTIGNIDNSRLNITDVRRLNNYHKRNPSIPEHDMLPEESKADLDAFRFLLKKEGIYDSGKQDFTPEMFKKTKKSATKDRLQSVYSDKDIIYLMNNVAENKGTDNSSNYAQQGGIIEVKDSKIAGKGVFLKQNIGKGDFIGLAHTNDQPSTELGRKHNHSETPNAESIKEGSNRYLISLKPIKKGEEVTVDYRKQPELEQPESFNLTKAEKQFLQEISKSK